MTCKLFDAFRPLMDAAAGVFSTKHNEMGKSKAWKMCNVIELASYLRICCFMLAKPFRSRNASCERIHPLIKFFHK